MKPDSCNGCSCFGHGTDFSQVEGTGALKVLIVAEASGKWEQLEKLPLRPYAEAGSVFSRIVKMAGFQREQFSITNILRCRPKNDWLDKSPWEYSAINHCRQNLDQVIQERQPKAIWALGNIALRELTGFAGKDETVTSLQGYVLEGPKGIPTIGSVHPSHVSRGASEFYRACSEQLKRAVQVARDGFKRHHTDYITNPSLDDVLSFEYRVNENQGALLTYDIETPNSRDMPEDERENDPSFVIESIQLSIAPFTGIFLPHTPEYAEIAKRIMAKQHRKAGWNNRGYDDPRLRANGYTINGLVEDFMHKWHSIQPDLPQNLQFAGSFLRMDFPWKHLSGSEPEFYGCADVDAPQRADEVLTNTLRQFGMEESYNRYVRDFYQPVLLPMSERGLPVHNEKRVLLGDYLDEQKEITHKKTIDYVPTEVLKMEPKKGYAGVPPRVKNLIQLGKTVQDIAQIPHEDPQGHTFRFVVGTRPIVTKAEGIDLQQDLLPVTVHTAEEEACWFRRYDFNPNSSDQIISYMKHRGHPVPKKHKETNADGSKKDTTDQKELERLFVKTGDMLYKWVPEYRSFDKMKGTYVDGFAPGTDGRVHTTFTYAPAQWQLSSRNPNTQNIPVHVGLASKVLQMFEAPPGYKWIGFDFKSFHPLMLAFEARDADYMRLVRMDVHSYLTAHFEKLPDRERLLSLGDDELRERLAYIKKTHKHTRDYKCKRVVCGWGNGQGYKLCFAQWREYFESEGECKKLFQLLEALFPKTTKRKIQMTKEASIWPEHGGKPYLLSRYKAIRWFWETYRWSSKDRKLVPGADFNKAQAFYGPNDAFGHMRDVMWAVQENYWDDRYQMVNNIHDALYFLCPEKLDEECISNVREIAQMPNTKLVDPVIAPDGMWCEVGVKIGRNLDDKSEGNPIGMEELKLQRPEYPLYGPLNLSSPTHF